MRPLFKARTITSLLITGACTLFLTACDRDPTDPPQPTTQGTDREVGINRDSQMQPGTPIAPLPIDPATPVQPTSPGTGTGTQ